MAMKQFRIVSLQQFKLEKDHSLQIRAMVRLRDAIDEYPGRSQEEKERLWKRLRLVLNGSDITVHFATYPQIEKMTDWTDLSALEM